MAEIWMLPVRCIVYDLRNQEQSLDRSALKSALRSSVAVGCNDERREMIRIPVIHPTFRTGDDDAQIAFLHRFPQPMMSLKELEPDKTRYDAWKAGIARTPRKVKR